jgi:hypothetical protein
MDTRARLLEAREKLDAKDLAGAMAVYERLLAEDGEGAEVLATISGDLGATGHIPELIDILAPLYEPGRHGPAAGLNLLQAYLAIGDPDAARHVLALLEGLNRPELEDRLRGFEVAIARMNEERVGNYTAPRAPAVRGSLEPPPLVARASLVSISKPVWFYGLEALAAEILPVKEGRLRRIAFAQLSVGGVYSDPAQAGRGPEDEFARLARALPLWLAETFFFSPLYSPFAAIAVLKETDGASLPLLLDHEWTADNLRQLVETTSEAPDYVFTGRLTKGTGDIQLILHVWEVKKFRERKQFTASWTPATADAVLASLHKDVCRFMECVPSSDRGGVRYSSPASPVAWLDVLASSVGLFLAAKDIFPKGVLAPLGPTCATFAPMAADSAMASLAWLTLTARARALGLAPDLPDPVLSADPLVAKATGSGCTL